MVVVHVQLKRVKKMGFKKKSQQVKPIVNKELILVLIETQSKSVYGRTCAIENNTKVKPIVNQEYFCRDKNESKSCDKQCETHCENQDYSCRDKNESKSRDRQKLSQHNIHKT